MAVTRQTIRLANGGVVSLGAELDAVTRDLVRAWVRAWDRIAGEIENAVLEMASGQLNEAGTVARIRLTIRGRQALAIAQSELERLSAAVDIRVSGLAEAMTELGAVTEGHVLASQLPRRAAHLITTFDQVRAPVVDAIVRRITDGIVAATLPLGRVSAAAMRDALVSGVPLGMGPRETARLMVRKAEGAFNGGLSRALNIARTETIDAYRSGAWVVRAQNENLVEGVVWSCALDDRVCPACISMQGQQFPAATPGPDGHPSCRCYFLPITVPWSQLGFQGDEPKSLQIEDGKSWFSAQPEITQRKIMGPSRLEAFNSGRIGWDDMAHFRSNPGWRQSIEVPSLKSVIGQRGVA